MKCLHLNKPWYSTSEQNNSNQESQELWSTRTVLSNQEEIKYQSTQRMRLRNSWTDCMVNFHLLWWSAGGRWEWSDHEAGCPHTKGDEGRHACQVWLKVVSHCLLSPCYKEALLPSTEKCCRKQRGGWDLRLLHSILHTLWSSLLKAGAHPFVHSDGGLHREASPW